MPKGRHLKPDFFTDKNIVSLSPLARLLYQGLWCFAADCGHLDDEPVELKMRILPADNCDVDALLDELVWHKRIDRSHGTIYLPKLGDHARVDKRYETHCEACKAASNHGGTTPSPRSDHDVTTKGSPRDHDADGDGDGEVMVMGKVIGSALARTDTRPDVDRLCNHLADQIEANGSKRPNITAKWRDAARLMLDRDGRTEAEVLGAIDWSQTDTFWRGVVMSMPKLRDKFDQMRLQATSRRGNSRQAETDGIFARALARGQGGTA